MNTELYYLTLSAAFTGLLWLPYVVDRILKWGLLDAVGYPANPKPQSEWAQRLMKAHSNAIENLVVFAALVLVAHAMGLASPAIAIAAVVYFWARIVHALAYLFKVPWIRTVGFFAGFLAQMVVAWQILFA
jgi:uncharacterized MAPEG superfamily protein